MIIQTNVYACDICKEAVASMAEEVGLGSDPVVGLPDGWDTTDDDLLVMCPECVTTKRAPTP